MRLAIIAIACAALLAPPSFAQTGSATGSSQLVIQVCNESGRDAFSAVIYQNDGTWHGAGWFRVNNGECGNIAISDNLRFYAFAEEVGNTEYYWSGTFEHCISRPGPYNELIDASQTVCPNGQASVMFTEWVADQYGTFTWTLDP